MLETLTDQLGLCFVNFGYELVEEFTAIHVLLRGCFTNKNQILLLGKLLSRFNRHLSIKWPFHAYSTLQRLHLRACILHHQMHLLHMTIILLYLTILLRVFDSSSATS